MLNTEQKAAKWDALEQEILDKYYQYDEQGNPIENEENEDGLIGIGELCLKYFGL